MNTSSEDFKSSDVNGVVSYKGKPVAVLLRRKGWSHLPSSSIQVDKAVSRAISGSPDGISASELRRKITESL